MKKKTTKILFSLFEFMVIGLAVIFVLLVSMTIAWWFKLVTTDLSVYIQPALLILGVWAGAVIMIGMSALDSKGPIDPHKRF